jgi:hypothetical protein
MVQGLQTCTGDPQVEESGMSRLPPPARRQIATPEQDTGRSPGSPGGASDGIP